MISKSNTAEQISTPNDRNQLNEALKRAKNFTYIPDEYREILGEIFMRTPDDSEAQRVANDFFGLDGSGMPTRGETLNDFRRRLTLVSTLNANGEKAGIVGRIITEAPVQKEFLSMDEAAAKYLGMN